MYYRLNIEKNGIEIYFGKKPVHRIRTLLLSKGWKYNPKKYCWYKKYSLDALSFAKELTGEKAEKNEVQKKKSVNLLDKVNYKPIKARGNVNPLPITNKVNICLENRKDKKPSIGPVMTTYYDAKTMMVIPCSNL